MAIGPRRPARTVHHFGERGQAVGQHAAPIVQLVQVAIAFAHLGQCLVHVELEVERALRQPRRGQRAQHKRARRFAGHYIGQHRHRIRVLRELLFRRRIGEQLTRRIPIQRADGGAQHALPLAVELSQPGKAGRILERRGPTVRHQQLQIEERRAAIGLLRRFAVGPLRNPVEITPPG